MKFKKVEIEDYEIIKPFVENQSYRVSEYAFGTLYMWRDAFNTTYATEDGVMYIRHRGADGSRDIYVYPLFDHAVTEEEKTAVINKLRREAEGPLTLGSVPDRELEAVKALSDDLEIESDRGWSDYLYNFDDIFTMAGRRFSAKRNHLKNFDKAYPDAVVEWITPENLPEVIEFYKNLSKQEAEAEAAEAAAQQAGTGESTGRTSYEEALGAVEDLETLNVLEHIEELHCTGIVLRVGGNIAGFTVGEIVGDTLIIHIEKADKSYKGAYPKVFSQYVKLNEGKGIRFINREEDMGDLGLRQSKLSYHPTELLHKHLVTFPRLLDK